MGFNSAPIFSSPFQLQKMGKRFQSSVAWARTGRISMRPCSDCLRLRSMPTCTSIFVLSDLTLALNYVSR